MRGLGQEGMLSPKLVWQQEAYSYHSLERGYKCLDHVEEGLPLRGAKRLGVPQVREYQRVVLNWSGPPVQIYRDQLVGMSYGKAILRENLRLSRLGKFDILN